MTVMTFGKLIADQAVVVHVFASIIASFSAVFRGGTRIIAATCCMMGLVWPSRPDKIQLITGAVPVCTLSKRYWSNGLHLYMPEIYVWCTKSTHTVYLIFSDLCEIYILSC